jgi:lipopolysaccharide/colanic/teichoic acid biosynthesis glycosyltransferase
MIRNADKLKDNLLKDNERKGPLFKIQNDPRIKKWGKILRKTSIDEIPQFLNILK